MKKILVVITYSGGGQWTEEAVVKSGMESYCIHDNVFDTNCAEDIDRLRTHISKKNYEAVIFDGYWSPEGRAAITHMQIAFAGEIAEKGVEPFILIRSGGNGMECELWRFFKPLAFKDMKEPVLFLARVGRSGEEVFDTETGKVAEYSGGDRGDWHRHHDLNRGRSFRDRNWPEIKRTVEGELKETGGKKEKKS